MPRYRICKKFTVESGHMLSKHSERCRFPHGHTRHIEVVVSCETLDANDMVLDFSALKLAVAEYVNRLDHAMAVNSNDPMLDAIRQVHPDSLIVFEDTDPTTEVMAKDLYDYVERILRSGFSGLSKSGHRYTIPPSTVQLERVRVWETPTSWAEFGE